MEKKEGISVFDMELQEFVIYSENLLKVLESGK
jgi:hypothetical protein